MSTDHDHHHDHHGHEHGHDHHHGHGHGHPNAFAFGTGVNLLFVVVEGAAGFWAGSMALLADAGHNLGDAAGLLLAWVAVVLARRRPTARHSYGLKRLTILAAFANAFIIASTAGALMVESATHLMNPHPVPAKIVLWVSAAGVVVNGGSALLFLRGRKNDLNIRAAYLHLAADAAISLGVVVTGVIMLYTGWYWLDPLAGVLVTAFIFWNAWALLKESFALSLDAVPAGVDPEAVKTFLLGMKGVAGIHDLHIWALSTTETALTAHLVVPEPAGAPDRFISEVRRALHTEFDINHTTIQVECESCPVECSNGSHEF